MTEKQKQELFAMLFYAKQDYRRRVQSFGSTRSERLLTCLCSAGSMQNGKRRNTRNY